MLHWAHFLIFLRQQEKWLLILVSGNIQLQFSHLYISCDDCISKMNRIFKQYKLEAGQGAFDNQLIENGNSIIIKFEIGMKEIQATVLSKPIDITFFDDKENRRSTGFSIMRYFWGEEQTKEQGRNQRETDPKIQIFEFYDRLSIAYSTNQLEMFSAQFLQNKSTIEYFSCQILNFDEKIQSICSNQKHSSPSVLLLVQLESQIRLYRLEIKQKKLIYRSNYSMKRINSLCFFGPNSICAVTGNNCFWEFECSSNKINKKTSQSFDTHSEKQYGKIVKGYLTGVTEHLKQEYSIYYFYIAQKQQQEGPKDTIMIKQFKKKAGAISISQTFIIKERDIKKSRLLSKADVFYYKNAFVLILQDEIVIIKKMFDQYLLIDNIRKRMENSYMMCNDDGIFCFCSGKIIEVCKIQIQDNRCELENVNIIECALFQKYELCRIQNYQDNYFFYFRVSDSWRQQRKIKKVQKEQQKQIPIEESQSQIDQKQILQTRDSKTQIEALESDTDDANLMKLACLVKQNSMKKLLSLSKNGVHPKMFFQLSSRLGVSKKDFFLEQWRHSNKHLSDINTILFETEDISIIKYELKMSYHRHAFQLVQHISIYNKLFKMIQHKLTLAISKKLIKQYAKCHFLLRKLKIQYNKSIQYKQFMEISKKGIIENLQNLYLQYKQASKMSTRQKQKQGKTVKYQLIMKNILSQYHVIFLQNYQKDLIEIIKPFKLNLEQFFEKFPFYLPQYPYKFEFVFRTSEKPEQNCNQHKLYNTIKESDWEQQLNVEQIRKQLEKYHPTSLVAEKMEELINDAEFRKARLVKHGVIFSAIGQYIDKASTLSGTKLFLKMCEFNNLNEKEQHSLKLLKVFQEKNNLKGQALLTCQFYSQLHFLLNSQKISDIGIHTLTTLQSADIFALFFLGNKQKISHVLTDLKPIYHSYCRKVSAPYSCAFSSALAGFVYSDICSPVEIKQLLFKVKEKGHDFQNNNQELISIIIDGYCYRTQIRETKKMQELIDDCLIQIKLTQQLNTRIMRISTILKMYDDIEIFRVFKCDTLSVLDVQKNGMKILSTILQNFFEKKMIWFKLTFEDKEIQINNPRNMLNVLLLIAERLYEQEITNYQILLMYGMCLIQYQCFDILDHLIWEEEVLDLLEIGRQYYCHHLISNALSEIYKDKRIQTFDEVRGHIKNILNLFPQDYEGQSDFLVREHARLKIGEIISDAGFQVSPSEMEKIETKQNFMDELIQNGYEDLSLQIIRSMNVYLKRLSGQREDQDDGDFLTWVALFSKMLIKNYSPKAMESVNFLIEKDCFYQLYNMFTQAMLQAVARLYPQESAISRRIIQYYVFSYHNYSEITQMFRLNFSPESVLYQSSNEQSFKKSFQKKLQVHESLFHLQLLNEYQRLDDLQRLARKVSKTTTDFYRYYYFLMTILWAPERGNSISQIEYDYQTLWQLIQMTGDMLIKRKQLHRKIGVHFNNYLFQKNLFVGLCQEGCNLTNIPLIQKEVFEKKINQNQFSCLFKELKQQNYIALLKVIKKSFLYLQRYQQTHKNKLKKVELYIKSMKQQIQDIKQQGELQQQQFGGDVKALANQIRLNKTMTYGQFKNDYLNYSTINPHYTGSQILNMIWEDKVHSPRTIQHNKRESNFVPMSPTEMDFYFPSFRSDEYYFQLFEKGNKQKILEMKENQLMPLLRKYYERAKLSDFVKLMTVLQIAEERNLKMVQSAMRLEFQIDFKEVFSFDFFFYRPDNGQRESKEYFEMMFQYLKPNLKQIINQNNWYLSKIVYSFFKFQKIYEYKTIMLALQKYLSKSHIDTIKILEVVRPMLQKLSSSYLAYNFQSIIGWCKTNDVESVILEMLNEILERSNQVVKEKLEQQEIEMIETVKERIREMIFS